MSLHTQMVLPLVLRPHTVCRPGSAGLCASSIIILTKDIHIEAISLPAASTDHHHLAASTVQMESSFSDHRHDGTQWSIV